MSPYEEAIAEPPPRSEWKSEGRRAIDGRLIDLRMVYPDVQVQHRPRARPTGLNAGHASTDADVLVISRPAHGGFVHYLGATARAVIREAACPVRSYPDRCDERDPRASEHVPHRAGAGTVRACRARTAALPSRCPEVRFHGRGGQGVVTAAELLSVAAFDQGHAARRSPVSAPKGPARPRGRLLPDRGPADPFPRPGHGPGRRGRAGPDDAAHSRNPGRRRGPTACSWSTARAAPRTSASASCSARLVTVPASDMLASRLGLPLPNTVLLGALAGLTEMVSLDALQKAIRSRFGGDAGERNAALAADGHRLAREASQKGVPVLRQIEGSRAVAETVARCRPDVVAAYPISPQTHIVEALSDLVGRGQVGPCQFLMVESEFGAMSACIGASAAGGRAYTATASQGLLFMAEALPNASGLRLPIVMTVANRALGAPINIWNDHSDAMSQRDAGWIQLFAASNQEAVDLHVQAFAVAESLHVPVMVCVDGFVLTHAMEAIDVPDQEQVDALLPPFRPLHVLDPEHPVTIGAMVGPEAFTEVKYLEARRQLRALDAVRDVADRFHESPAAAAAGSPRRTASRTPTWSWSRSAPCSAPQSTWSTSSGTRASRSVSSA